MHNDPPSPILHKPWHTSLQLGVVGAVGGVLVVDGFVGVVDSVVVVSGTADVLVVVH